MASESIFVKICLGANTENCKAKAMAGYSANVKTRTNGYFTLYRKKKRKKRHFLCRKNFSNPDWLPGCGRDILIFFPNQKYPQDFPKLFLSQSEFSKKFYPKKSLGAGATPLF